MTKNDLFSTGMELLQEFCSANTLTQPAVRAVLREDWRFPQTCAYYRSSMITICIPACSPLGMGGRAWSWPGYVIDRTPHGVLQHELGHYVDQLLSERKGSYGGDFSTRVRDRAGEEKLTNYCPNDWEWFAEMFRLFVTNSDLLRVVRPKTHSLLKEHFRPVVDAPWREVLRNAPARTIEMAAKKMTITQNQGDLFG